MSNKQTLLSIFILIVAFNLLYFMFWDSFGETKQAFNAWRKERRELKSLQELIADSPMFSKKIDSIATSIPFLFEALPSVFDESNYLTKFSSIASGSGMILTKIDVSPPDATGNVSASVALSGSIASLERFLKDLETALPLFDFSTTGFTSSEGGKQFDVRFVSYILSKDMSKEVNVLPESAGLPGGQKKGMSYEELKQKLDSALAINTDIVKDPRIEQFKKSSPAPSPSPSPALGKDEIGRDDPFAPL